MRLLLALICCIFFINVFSQFTLEEDNTIYKNRFNSTDGVLFEKCNNKYTNYLSSNEQVLEPSITFKEDNFLVVEIKLEDIILLDNHETSGKATSTSKRIDISLDAENKSMLRFWFTESKDIYIQYHLKSIENELGNLKLAYPSSCVKWSNNILEKFKKSYLIIVLDKKDLKGKFYIYPKSITECYVGLNFDLSYEYHKTGLPLYYGGDDCKFEKSKFEFHLPTNCDPIVKLNSTGVNYKIDEVTYYSEKYLTSRLPGTEQKNKPEKKVVTGTGSGFLLTKKGHFITNYHVIEDAKSIEITLGEKSYPAEIVQVDKSNDLALIKITSSTFISPEIPYTIKATSASLGEKVFTLGFPMSDLQGKNLKLTDGLISSKTGFKDDPTTYQISVPLQPGNSGGPLFDQNGNLVGVVNAGILEANSVGYAIKCTYLNNFLDTIDGLELPKSTSLIGKPFTTQVEMLSKICGIVTVKN